jgi:rod shape-determining protein MreD
VRALVSFVLTAVTVVVQLTIVDRIAFPGGGGPDLVLLLVAALALAGGPMAGVLTGFLAGLALDVAPPGSHFTGEDALVFCLIGYACGLLADDFSGDAEQGHTALFEIVVTAAGAVCGEALVALLGVMLSDPRVSWPAITNVLPAAVAYDVLLCPFVLYAAAASLRLAGVRREGHRPGWSAGQARSQLPATSQGAIRQLAGGNGPRLRLSERDRSPGAAGSRLGSGGSRPVARREPQLKLGRPAARAGAAFAPGGLASGSARVKFARRRREGVLGGSLLGGSGLGSNRLGGFRLAGGGGARFGRSSMGRSLLGGSVFSRSASSLDGGSVFGRAAPLGRSSPLRHRGNLMRSAGGGLGGRAPRLSRAGTPKSPGRNWLRGTSARGGMLGGSSLGRSGLGRSGLGRTKLGGRSMGRKAFGRSRLARPRTPKLSARRRWGKGGYL